MPETQVGKRRTEVFASLKTFVGKYPASCTSMLKCSVDEK